jgi:hypothetical protein
VTFGSVGATILRPEEVPQPGNLRYGIFNVAPPQSLPAPPPEDPNRNDHAFAAGMYYDPVGCGPAHPYAIVCPPSGSAAKTFDPNSAERLVLPFAVYASIQCSKGGVKISYLTSKTEKRLFSSEQAAVEAALWSGGFGNAPFLIDNSTSVLLSGAGTFATITDAVSAIEQAMYGGVPGTLDPYGYFGVIHATPAVHAYASAAGLVDTANVFGAVWGVSPNEAMLRTPLGSKWVFGGGYAGTGPGAAGAGAAPAAGKTYIWGTGNVSLWRTDDWTPPDELQVMDRTLNQYKLLYERVYLATYDCFNVAALVNIPKVAV